MFARIFRISFLVVVLLIGLGSPLFAQDATDPVLLQKEQEINDLKQKISNLQGQAQTLSSALTYLDNKKILTQKEIDATVFEISLLQRDITSINGKITLTESNLDTLTKSLLQSVSSAYKRQSITMLDVLFSTRQFSTFFVNYRYIQATQQHYQDLVTQTTQTRLNYDVEKQQKELKQKQIQGLQDTLTKQQADLISQEQAKQQLLNQTKDSESNYQKLLTQAVAELNALRNFSQSMGGGVLPPQTSPDGWYYSQRDQRWANMCIGNSCGTSNSATIIQVGCLISSVAMILTKFGQPTTPLQVAANSSYFFSTTAYMLLPWPAPNGYHWASTGRDLGKIDSELSAGRPVIVHMMVNSSDGHFIVIKSGSNGNYVMHDPWQGYDKNFTDFYTVSQISSVNYLVH